MYDDQLFLLHSCHVDAPGDLAGAPGLRTYGPKPFSAMSTLINQSHRDLFPSVGPLPHRRAGKSGSMN